MNPTSLWLKWSRTFVKSSPQHPINQSTPSPPLEEGFSPPPPSSLVSGIEVSISIVGSHMRSWRHPGHHHFFIIFSTPFYIDFYSISTPNLEQKSMKKSIKNRFQERLRKLPTFCIDFHRFLMDLKVAGTSF